MRDRARSAVVGRNSKLSGDAHELWVEQQHELAKRLGIVAHVEHNEPHGKIVGGRVIYTSAGVADYTGTLEGGRSLATEAKSTTRGERFYKSHVTAKQQEHLGAVALAGGLSLLVIEFRAGSLDEYLHFAVPWLDAPWEVLKSAESVSAERLLAREEWRVHRGQCYLSRYHPGGASSTPHRFRTYSRE